MHCLHKTPSKMEEQHRKTLQQKRIFILDNLTLTCVKRIVDVLFSEDVLTEDMKDEILVERVVKDQIGRLLDILPKRGKNAFTSFIWALNKTGNTHIASELEQHVSMPVHVVPLSRGQGVEVQEKTVTAKDEATTLSSIGAIIHHQLGLMRGQLDKDGEEMVDKRLLVNLLTDVLNLILKDDAGPQETPDTKTTCQTPGRDVIGIMATAPPCPLRQTMAAAAADVQMSSTLLDRRKADDLSPSEVVARRLACIGDSIGDTGSIGDSIGHISADTNMLQENVEKAAIEIIKQANYNDFKETVRSLIGDYVSWNKIAVLFYVVKKTVNLAGTNRDVALRVKEMTLRYFEDNLASWVVEQGGWEEINADSDDDDFEVD
ncbi:hypothetical protein ScPMuIL_014390 [Solemya velum]